MELNTVTPESVGFSSTRLNRIGTAMRGYVDQGRPPGLIAAVARRGKVAHFGCYGMRDVEAGKPMRPDTLFRLYSLTKPITAVTLMMLLEEGRFLLDDPVSKFIPPFKNLHGPGGGYGLGFGVELDETQRPTLTSTGAYGWGSAASCRFWVNPQEELIGISMLQTLWGSGLWVGKRFQNLVYQTIVD